MAYIQGEGRSQGSIKKADEEQQANIDPSAVQAAIERLKQHPEPEAGYMLVRQTALPAYNVQTAVDAEYSLIVAHAVVLDASDIRCLQPMAEAAKHALELETFNVVADCRLLQRGASRALRSSRYHAVCSGHAHGQQSRGWHPIRSY